MNVFDSARTVTAYDVAERYAGVVPHKKTYNRIICRCPFPDHDDRNPSCTFSISGKFAGHFICTCEHRGNSIDFVSQYFNVEPLDAAKMICNDFGLAYDQKQDLHEKPAKKPISREELNNGIRKLDTITVKASVLYEIWLEQCKRNGTDVYERLISVGIEVPSEEEIESVRDQLMLNRNKVVMLRDELLKARQEDDTERLTELLLENAEWARNALEAIRSNKREIKAYMSGALWETN